MKTKTKNKTLTISVKTEIEKLKKAINIGNELLCISQMDELCIHEEPVTLDSVIIGVCLDGEMRMNVDGIEHYIRPCDSFVISIGHIISNLRVSSNYQGMAMFGSQSFFHDVVKEMIDMSKYFMFVHNSPIRQFNATEMEMFTTAYKLLVKRAPVLHKKYGVPFAISVVRAFCYDFFNSSLDLEMQATPTSTKGEKVFFEFVKLVEANFRVQRRVSWYAQQIGISSKYLSELVKTVSRETPNAWIDKYVVMELRVLLHNPNLNIKEITEIMNFPNQSFLGKYFKEHVGLSPLAYRKTL